MAIATGLLAASAGFGVAAPAAADYPPKEPRLSIAGCSDVRGGVKVKVKNLLRDTTLTVSWDGPSDGSVSTTTKANGTANATLPIKDAGTYKITAVGTDQANQPWEDSTSVKVLQSCSDSGLGGTGDQTGGGTGDSTGGLADTGADVAMLLTAGLGALAVGGAAVAVSRRRRDVQPETA